MYSTPLLVISDELLMMDGLQQLPSEHLAPQATSWVLNETRKKRQKLKGRVVFFFTNDSAVITPSGEAQLHPS